MRNDSTAAMGHRKSVWRQRARRMQKRSVKINVKRKLARNDLVLIIAR